MSSSPAHPTGTSWLWSWGLTTHDTLPTLVPMLPTSPPLSRCSLCVALMEHSLGPYWLWTGITPPQAFKTSRVRASPPTAIPRILGACSGRSSAATVGVRSMKLASSLSMAPGKSLSRSASDGTHTQPP